MTRLKLGVCAIALAACSQTDTLVSAPRSIQMKDFALRTSINGGRHTVPDPAAALADEAAALADIDAHLDAVSRATIMPILKGEMHDGYHYSVQGKTAEWSDRYARFYAARAHRLDEERRDASVQAAYKHGGVDVVVALGDVPSGTVATVLRRTETSPRNVIVLGSTATAETFGGAFAALDQSRKLEGDDLVNNITIGINDVHVTSIDAVYQARLEQLMARLRRAPTQVIDGVGTVQAIQLRSLKLRTK